jgi:hypothetical protein
VKDFGLVLDKRHRFVYGWHHGFGHHWLPHRMQRIISHGWNWSVCRLFGHEWMPDFNTAVWSKLPCKCPPEHAMQPGHCPEHTLPHDWTQDVCSYCSLRRPAREALA